MKKVKGVKEYGVFYYKKEKEEGLIEGIDFIYYLYNENQDYICSFPCYADMIYYIETGIII